MRSTTLAAPLLLELQRALLEREAWPLLRVALPGQERGFWDAARDRHLDGFPRRRARRGREHGRLARHPRAREHPRAGRRRPGTHRPRRPRPRAGARGRLAPPLERHALADARAAQQAGMATEDFAAFVRRALFLDRDDPIAAWDALRDRQARAGRAPLARAGDPDRGAGHRPRARRRRPHVDQLRRQPQHALGRGLHRPGRDLGRGPHPLRRPVQPARRRGRRRRARVPRGPRRRRARRPRRRRTSRPRSPPTTAPAASASSGIGTNFGIDRPVGQILFDEKIGGTVHLALGRSYPETGGTNESAAALGPDLRPPRRRSITADGEPVDVSPEAQREP